MFQRSYYLIFLLSCLFSACDHTPKKFKRLSETETGIDFQNTLVLSDSFNILEFDYIYNGGGVAVADFNNDRLPDLFFTGNQVSSELYLNRGQLQFEKVTESAGVKTTTWVEGVTVVDINNDGWLDLYISASGGMYQDQHANLLFVNQGVNKKGDIKFLEQAHQYGIDDTGYNTQAAFLDYDLDGDLDLYVLSNALENFNRNTTRPRKKDGSGKSTDKLYRNDAGYFTDVSSEAGILIEGYGLGVVVQDFNKDGWPDIYVANDFISNDLLYVNQKNGTFKNQIADQMRHQSHNGMGVDAADFNNDGYADVLVLDMLPETNARQKSMMTPFANYDRFMLNLSMGYEPQYVRNTLQLNLGNGYYSEIGQLSGVHQTDWSWSPVFADLDNDGYRDLFISNGYGKDITDMDYISYSQSLRAFGTEEARMEAMRKEIEHLEEIRISNYIYRNNGDLTFTDASEEWGMNEPTLSNGAVYADLDNDGDLDLIVNNINDPASIYENNTITETGLQNNYLKVKLRGSETNLLGLGAKVTVYYHEGEAIRQQYHEHYITRGYKSSVDPIIHFGLGSINLIDSMKVVWPDGRRQLLSEVDANEVISIDYHDPQVHPRNGLFGSKPIFEQVSAELEIDFEHEAVDFPDFKYQPLLPHKHSENGPGIAVGDVNGDGLDDFFVGGSEKLPGSFFWQTPSGNFVKKKLEDESVADDMGVLLLDVDNDGDLDLYVTKGGSRYPDGDSRYQDKLYKNDGTGHFFHDEKALPVITASGSVVTAADFDLDGDLDLFVGGRVVPHQYPLPARSYLLENQNGIFVDVTQKYGSDMAKSGMITAAIWSDYDQDGRQDLLVAGEWMPITIFKQVLEADGSVRFKNVTKHSGLDYSQGWWNSLYGADFDNDGDIDYVAGNLGTNSRLKASKAEPLSIYAKDFDENGEIDPIMFYYNQHQNYPVASRDLLISQIAGMKGRFPKYRTLGETTFDNFFTEKELDGAYVLKAHEMRSCLIENLGDGNFQLKPLPVEAQFSPVCGVTVDDFNQDHLPDVLMVGNSYSTELMTGRYDAGYGVLLAGDGTGNFHDLPVQQSGFVAKGNTKSLVRLVAAEGSTLYLTTRNQGKLLIHGKQQKNQKMFLLDPSAKTARIFYEDGTEQFVEYYYGAGYLGQSSRVIAITQDIKTMIFYDHAGEEIATEDFENVLIAME